MPVEKKQTKATRGRYSYEFKAKALGLSEQVGVVGAAKQLGLHESQFYAWRKKAWYEASRSETEKKLAIENARLKRQLAKKDEELAIKRRSAEIPIPAASHEVLRNFCHSPADCGSARSQNRVW